MSKYYSKRRKQNGMDFKDLVAIVACVIIIGGGMFGALWYHSGQDYYYYTADGEMVDRPCEIVEINGDIVTVVTLNGGELYDFYGDGYNVGDTIVCTFNQYNELIATDEY